MVHSADSIVEMHIRTFSLALSAVTIAVALLGSTAFGAQNLDHALPKAQQIGSGWAAEGRPKVTSVSSVQSSGDCGKSVRGSVAPTETSQLFVNLPTTSQLRVTLFIAKDGNSGSQLWTLLAKCVTHSSGAVTIPKLQPIRPFGTSRSEHGGWLKLPVTGGDALVVLYVAQTSNVVGAYSFFGSEDLASASTAIKHDASALHNLNT